MYDVIDLCVQRNKILVVICPYLTKYSQDLEYMITNTPNNIRIYENLFGTKMNEFITYEEFRKVEIRLGTVIKAEEYLELKHPSIKLEIDFGEKIGIKKSSAQILKYYNPKNILGKQVAAVINFQPKQIGKFLSEVRVLGFPDNENISVLFSPDIKLDNGVKIF